MVNFGSQAGHAAAYPEDPTASLIMLLSRNSPLSEDRVVELIEAGADITYACNRNGHQAIHQAANNGQIEALNALVRRGGADINICSGHTGDAAIHSAAKIGDVSMLDAVLSLGADIEKQMLHTQSRQTALEAAAMEICFGNAINIAGCSQVAFRLLQHGARMTPDFRRIISGNIDAIEEGVKDGNRGYSSENSATKLKCLRAIQGYIDKADERLVQWQKHRDTSQLKGDDLIYLANQQATQDVLRPALWAEKVDRLMTLLCALPAPLLERVAQSHPWIHRVIAAPDSVVDSKSISLNTIGAAVPTLSR